MNDQIVFQGRSEDPTEDMVTHTCWSDLLEIPASTWGSTLAPTAPNLPNREAKGHFCCTSIGLCLRMNALLHCLEPLVLSHVANQQKCTPLWIRHMFRQPEILQRWGSFAEGPTTVWYRVVLRVGATCTTAERGVHVVVFSCREMRGVE